MKVKSPNPPGHPTTKRFVERLPPGVKRVHGYLYCRVCQRSWAFFGADEPQTWPQHRCGKGIEVFHEFTLEDPNHVGIPDWRV